jgi:hypothetical protein
MATGWVGWSVAERCKWTDFDQWRRGRTVMEVGILASYISLKSLDMPLGWPDLHGRLKIKGKQF